jgi:hypothetical protein
MSMYSPGGHALDANVTQELSHFVTRTNTKAPVETDKRSMYKHRRVPITKTNILILKCARVLSHISLILRKACILYEFNTHA